MGTPKTIESFKDAMYDWSGLIIRDYILENYNPKSTKILDVGAGWGKYAYLLHDYVMDACEIWDKYIEEENLENIYRHVYNVDICDMAISKGVYDVIIFGDVLEHIETSEAQQLIKRLSSRVKDIVVAVPFLYKQGEVEGNPYEEHKQPDLTPTLMAERYPQLKQLEVSREKGIYVKR